MNSIKKTYVYWFCAVNKIVTKTDYWGMSINRTIGIMMLTEVLLLSIFGSTFSYLSKEILIPKYPVLTIFGLLGILLGIKYLIFIKNDQWRTYITEFEQLSKRKRELIYYISILFNIVILLAFIYSNILLSNTDWVYRIPN